MRERICFIAPTFPRRPGGGALTIYEHANGLARRGYRVSVLHSLNRRTGATHWVVDLAGGKLQDLRAGNLRRRVSWLKIDPRVQMLTVDRLDESTRLPPADLWIGTFWSTTHFLASRMSAARMMQLIQAYETWAGPAEQIDAAWRLPIHAAVVSHNLKRKGIDLGVPAHRLHVVPNGLDHGIYRADLVVPNRPPCLTFHASANPVKGLADAIEVVHRVHRRRPDVAITAFGIGRRMAALPDFVEYVRGLSGRSLVERIYGHASLLLCASHSEGWGFPSIEAMACGVALVSTRNGGVDDFAKHEESALLCNVGDISALTDSVLALLADETRRREIAERGIQSAARFTWEASTDAMEHAVQAALERIR